jgi:hypothetical protein
MDYAYSLEKRLEWLQWAKSQDARDLYVQPGMAQSFYVYRRILESGDTFFVNKRFCELVDLARRTIPDALKFENEWMLAPKGFMWLEDPFQTPQPTITDAWDTQTQEALDSKLTPMRISAIGWEQVPDNQIPLMNQDERGFVQKSLGEQLKPGAIQFVCFMDFQLFNSSAKPGFGMWSYFVLNPGAMLLDRIHRFENVSIESIGSATYAKSRTTDMLHEIRWIYAAMHLMSQKLASRVPTPAQRPTKRRMQKANVPFVPLVKVITLRRMEEHNKAAGPSREVDWQWQWPVTGHWRNQYLPSVGEHRHIWIEDYVKGPVDKPMKPPQHKIFKAER